MTTELQIIKRARELLSDPKRWTRTCYARDRYGCVTGPLNDDAVCWCAMGAIERAGFELGFVFPKSGRAVDRVYRHIGAGNTLTKINDTQGHAAVLALFDKALEQEAAE